ncbi:heme o synthase [Bacillus xiapuensis]|uniref:heme o synthase n=1 Tax=Bacillus xiapuensis TaxID=2014075 RepID=UPI000C23F96B|nr:heme o synthase [Bacillus xiapuensis]
MRKVQRKQISIQSRSLNSPEQPLSSVIAATIKTGIIKSNLLAMMAGLALALYMNQLNPLDKLAEIFLAVIGSFLIIGAAGAFNNLYDRDIDSVMERTKNRPTVAGTIKPLTVLRLGVLMTLFGLAALALASPLAAVMGFLGLFFYVVPYTMWSKRRTVYNTEIGSISGGMPPLIGWAAVDPNIFHPAIVGLFATTVIWQMPHFYAIAIRKHDDYKAANVPMLPVVKGFKRTYIQTNIYLVVLTAASFLFKPVGFVPMFAALLLNIAWLALSIFGYRKMGAEKWAKLMFIYSLLYIMVLFTLIILYSLIGMWFEM